MQDMLVKLYDLPDVGHLKDRLQNEGIVVRPALAAEKSLVVQWISQRFGEGWASEGEICFSFQPVSCFIAVREGKILGFACYEAAYRNFFGPTGVDEAHRGRGIGAWMLIECLSTMKSMGYAYAIIGGVGPADYYAKTVGASLIAGSDPGIYKGILSHVPV